MNTFRGMRALLAFLVPMLMVGCGGDDLVLPSEGTAASIAATRGNNQSGTVGAALADSLQVRVLDKAGRPVPNQPVAWAVVAGGGAVAPASSTTDGSGYAGASWTLGSGAGTQQVRAKPDGNGAPDNLQAVFSATAGASSAATLIKISGDSQTAVAGSVLPDSLVVRVTDANGNPVAEVPVTWSLTGGGAVSSASLPTGADGRSAIARTLGATAGKQTTTATATGLNGSPIEFVSTATVGSAGRLVIVTQPSSSASSGDAFPQQPAIQIQDANGNPVALAGIAVTAAMASNPGGGALIGNTTASTNASGLATFTNLGISGPSGDYTIGFSVPNRDDISGTPPSGTISISAGAAARLEFSVQPSNVATGATITPAVKVRIEDAQGTLVTSATNNVTIALSNNSTGATLSGTKTVAASGGIATFSNLSLNRPGTGYTLSASASGLSGDVSSGFNVTTGAATTIAANSSTSLSGTVGSPVSPAPSVKVTDGSGNGVSGVTVTFAVTAGGGSVSGATPTTNSSGVASVGSWTLGTTAGSNNNKLTATASGLSGSPVTFTASATAGSAGKLGFVTQPASSGTSGQPLSQQPVLQLLDADNNPVSTGGISVTASIASGPSGSLSGASVNTNSQGRATFTNLEISGPAGTYTLAFSAPSITGVTSNGIAIAAGGSTKLGVVTQPSATAQSGVVFDRQPVVRLEDASGNPVAQSGVNVAVSLNEGGATLGGDLTKTTDANGEATFTDLKLTGTPGTYSLLFAASGKTSVSSSDIALGAGPVSASASTVTASPTTFVAGDASGSTISVTAKDQSGNAINGASVSLSASNGGTFDPGSATTGTDGTATFTFTATTAGMHQISVTVNSTELDDKPTVTVSAGVVSGGQSTLTISPSSVEAGGGSSTVTVTANDQFDNPIAGASVALEVTGSGNTISTSPTPTNSSGVATFTVSSTVAEAKTVSATISGTAVTQTQTLTVTSAPVSGLTSRITFDQAEAVAWSTPLSGSVTLKDASGQLLANRDVSLSGPAIVYGVVSPTSGQTGEDGTFEFQYQGQNFGSDTVKATSEGVTIETPINVVTLPVSTEQSAIGIEASSGLDARAGFGISVYPLPRTAEGAFIPGALIQFVFEGTDIELSGPNQGWTRGNGGVDGYFVDFSTTVAQSVVIQMLVNGEDAGIELTVPVLDSGSAGSIGVSGDSPISPGAQSTVRLALADQYGNPMPDQPVTFSADGGSVAPTSGVTDSAGLASTIFTAPATSGNYTVQVQVVGGPHPVGIVVQEPGS